MRNGLKPAPCHSVHIIYPSLTLDEDARAGFHCGHEVAGDTLPRTLVLLGQRLQEQGAVGQHGVRCATHQVDLRRRKPFLQMTHWNTRFLVLGLCTHELSSQLHLKIIKVRFLRSWYKQRGSHTLYLTNCESFIIFHSVEPQLKTFSRVWHLESGFISPPTSCMKLYLCFPINVHWVLQLFICFSEPNLFGSHFGWWKVPNYNINWLILHENLWCILVIIFLIKIISANWFALTFVDNSNSCFQQMTSWHNLAKLNSDAFDSIPNKC